MGIMPLYQAREVAKKGDLDLVEVAPTAVPPVVRLLNYGKYKYEQTKKEREAKKGQKVSVLREIRLRPKIGGHDFEAKIRSAKKLLEAGNKVRVTVMFRGREITHPDLAFKLLQRVIESLKEEATVEARPVMDGRRMVAVLSQTASLKARAKEKEKEKVQETQNA